MYKRSRATQQAGGTTRRHGDAERLRIWVPVSPCPRVSVFPRPRDGSDNPFFFQPREVCVRQPQQRSQDFGVVLAQERCWSHLDGRVG